jgi:chromosome segregation ATPase
MHADKDRKFELSESDPSADGYYQDELNDIKLEKLGHRVTLITILVPILIIVILAVSYLDIKRKVVTVEDTGTTGYQQLSTDLASKFSALSVKYANLEEDLNNRLDALEKTSQSLTRRARTARANIKNLRADRATKKEFTAAVTGLTAAMTAVQDDLKTMDQNVAALDETIRGEMAQLVTLLESTGNRLIELEAQVATMTSDTVDREILEAQLQTLKEDIANSQKKTFSDLEKQIRANSSRLKAISPPKTSKKPTAAASTATAAKPPPPPPSTPEPTTTPPAPAGAPAPSPETPQPGQIIEQNLQ